MNTTEKVLSLVKDLKNVTENESKDILQMYGLPISSRSLVKSPEEAGDAAEQIGFPVVLKIVSPEIIHKTEAGGVLLNLNKREEAIDGFKKIVSNARSFNNNATIKGVLVEKMISTGQEVIIGIKRDAVFGPVLVFGLGGTLVEIMKDTSLRMCPVSKQEAMDMIREIKGFKLLTGYRGAPETDLDAIADIIVTVSRMALEIDCLTEMDLNPIIVGTKGNGATIVDARMAFKENIQELETGSFETNNDYPMAHLNAMINPQSIAVIGASNDHRKLGWRLVNLMLKFRFPGKIYPVNPKEDFVQGLVCYRSIEDIPDPVDLVSVLVPSERVPDIIRQCGEKKIKAAIVYSGGFSEGGNYGLERELLVASYSAGTRILGPNTIGLVNPVKDTCAAFSWLLDVEKMVSGNIGFITQSGAMGSCFISSLWEQGIGISKWIATGNESDLEIYHFIKFLINDASTKVIALYIEGIKSGNMFIEAALEALRAEKPIIAYKTGKSEAAKEAVKSHTGSLAGFDEVYNAVFKKAGILRVNEIYDLPFVSNVFSSQPLPQGKKIVSLSMSGGAGTIVVDECSDQGLEMTIFNNDLEKKLREAASEAWSIKNPIDLGAPGLQRPDLWIRTLKVLLEEDDVDGIIGSLTTIGDANGLKIAEGIAEAVRGNTKPFILTWMGAESYAPKAIAYLKSQGIPVCRSPRQSAVAMRLLVDYSEALKSKRL